MAEINLHEIYRYCKEHIDMFEEKEAIAWDYIDKLRCPLDMADDSLYYEMEEAVADYCDEHDLDYDELVEDGVIDIEKIFCTGEE